MFLKLNGMTDISLLSFVLGLGGLLQLQENRIFLYV